MTLHQLSPRAALARHGRHCSPAPARAASAQTPPSTPLRVILPVGAGSGVDTIMRAAQAALTKALGGQPVVIENLPGAGGITGTQAIVKARARRQHHRRGVEQPRRQPERLQEDAVRQHQRHHADHASSARRRSCWWSTRSKVPAKNAKELQAFLKAKPGASTTTRPRATAPSSIWPARCSSTRPASRSSTSRTRAWARWSPT